MFLTLKTSFVISVLTALALFPLTWWIKRDVKGTATTGIFANAAALVVLCVSQIYVAFAALALVTAVFTRKRAYAAGIAMFLLIVVPNLTIIVMAGSLQLVNLTSFAVIGFGLLIGSLMWSGPSRATALLRDLPAYTIMLVLVFIGARDSAVTNVLRVFTEAFLTFLIPYVVMRRGLSNGESIRNAFLLTMAAGLAISAVAVFESVRVWPMYQAYAQQFGEMKLANVKMRGGMLRAGGPMMNPPLSGAIMAFCLVTAIAAENLFRTKLMHRLVLAVLILGLFCVQTRAAWLGAVVGSVGVMFSRKGAKGLVAYIAPLLAVAGGIYAAAVVNPRVANLVGFSSDAKDSSQYRDRLADLGFETVRAHPVIGQPIVIVQQQMRSMIQGEGIIDFVNGYLAVALFSGLVGLGLFAGALLFQAVIAYRDRHMARRRGAGSMADLGVGIVAAAASMFPFVPTDQRLIGTMLLFFALANSTARGLGMARPATGPLL